MVNARESTKYSWQAERIIHAHAIRLLLQLRLHTSLRDASRSEDCCVSSHTSLLRMPYVGASDCGVGG